MKEPKEVPDCRSCGACCAPWQDQLTYCDLTTSDASRLGTYARKHALDGALRTKGSEQRSGPFRGLHVVTCVALRGSVLGKCSCAIYGKRPRACRIAIQPGNRDCLDLRKKAVAAAEIAVD